jgi:hypothetical protein
MDIIVLVAVVLLRLVGLTLDQLQEGVERLETAFVQYAAQEAPAGPPAPNCLAPPPPSACGATTRSGASSWTARG